MCYKMIDKEHGQTPYVLPSRKNYDGDRLSYLKLFSTCFGKFRGGVCGCETSFAPRGVPLDKEIYSNLCLPTMPASYRQIHKDILKQSHRRGHSSNQKPHKAGRFAQSTCCCTAPWSFHSVHPEPRTCRMELSCQTK